MPNALFEGLKATLETGIEERISQLRLLSQKVARIADGTDLFMELPREWPRIENELNNLKDYHGNIDQRDTFIGFIENALLAHGKSYLKVIKHLDGEQSRTGTHWLQTIVDHVVLKTRECLPSLSKTGSADA